mmetsp:Transcript_34884/g.74406  ORF Transcript_34884/g.74406 Transcript_34884/m.74406 type:complete len:327 (+) Transcript_34884:170-1150(+)
MSVFLMKKKSMAVHSKMMKARGSGTTTWYAFEDPTTGREFFHEPVSDKTTWVLPTSSNATRIERAGSALPGSMTKERDEKDAKSQHKQRHRWSAAGITVVSLLVFNTLFLLVLVKILYENSNESGQISDQIKLPVHAHEKSVEINLRGEDAGIKTQTEEVIIDIEADPISMLKDEALSASAQIKNETLNDNANKEEVEEGNDCTIEERPTSTSSAEVSGDNYTPIVVTELDDEHDPDSDETTKEGIDEPKEAFNIKEESSHDTTETKDALNDQELSFDVVKEMVNEEGDKEEIGAVLVRKCRRLRAFFTGFFHRLLHVVRRLVGRR